jgi:hypothetical protein
MVAPRPSQIANGHGCHGAHGSGVDRHGGYSAAGASIRRTELQSPQAKAKAPSVAAELLMSSALRMQWPVDRRKVSSGDAAVTCRDAAAMLQEAAAQLLGAAKDLENNGTAVNRVVSMADTQSKRRRTFGGPSPTRAPSPIGAATEGGRAGLVRPMAPRGSPPVRLAGLRV